MLGKSEVLMAGKPEMTAIYNRIALNMLQSPSIVPLLIEVVTARKFNSTSGPIELYSIHLLQCYSPKELDFENLKQLSSYSY